MRAGSHLVRRSCPFVGVVGQPVHGRVAFQHQVEPALWAGLGSSTFHLHDDVAGVQLHRAKPRAMNFRGSLWLCRFLHTSPVLWAPSLTFGPALTHNGIQGWALETG